MLYWHFKDNFADGLLFSGDEAGHVAVLGEKDHEIAGLEREGLDRAVELLKVFGFVVVVRSTNVEGDDADLFTAGGEELDVDVFAVAFDEAVGGRFGFVFADDQVGAVGHAVRAEGELVQVVLFEIFGDDAEEAMGAGILFEVGEMVEDHERILACKLMR